MTISMLPLLQLPALTRPDVTPAFEPPPIPAEALHQAASLPTFEELPAIKAPAPKAQKPHQKAKTQPVKTKFPEPAGLTELKARSQKTGRCDRCNQKIVGPRGVAATNFCEPCDRDNNPWYYVSEHHRILGKAGNMLDEICEELNESHPELKAVPFAGTRQFKTPQTEKDGRHLRLPFFHIKTIADRDRAISVMINVIDEAVKKVTGKTGTMYLTPKGDVYEYSIMGLHEHCDLETEWKRPPKEDDADELATQGIDTQNDEMDLIDL